MSLPTAKRKKRSSLDTSRQFYLFISPWLIGLVCFTLGPMFYSLYAAFSDWNGVTAPVFTGFANWRRMFLEDELFWRSIKNTFYYACVSVPLNLVVALFLAQMLNKKMPGTYFFRSIFYLPSVVAGVSVYIVWTYLFDPFTGVINDTLYYLGIQGPMWLFDEYWSMPSLIIMNIFTCGGAMLILLAGLQDISTEYYEAAALDGANGFQIFRRITFPLLTPVIFFNLVMSIISSLQIFTQPQIMTQGGPMYSTYVYGLHLYNNAFRYNEFGYASALAWMLFLIIMALSMLVFKSSTLWVHYREGVD